MGAVFVGVAKNGQTFAGDIKNLARGGFFLNVPGEPNGPTIMQSLLCSLVGGCFHSQHHKILFAYYIWTALQIISTLVKKFIFGITDKRKLKSVENLIWIW